MGYDDMHDRLGFGGRNVKGTLLLGFAKAFDLVISNMCFQKREDHLVTFRSTVAKTRIDYLFWRMCDKGMCANCKVITSECLSI